MQEIKYAYAYIRVSIREEKPENQRLAIQKWASQHNYIIPRENWFEDIGVSGAIPPFMRPGFSALFDRVKVRPLPVLIYELSRLGRSQYEVYVTVKKLEELGATVISVSPKETFMQLLDKSLRDLVLNILAWAAEREREYIIQRTKEGMERARKEGKRIGRPKIEINTIQLEELLRKGLSMSAIAKLMGVSYYTIRRRVKELGLKGGNEK